MYIFDINKICLNQTATYINKDGKESLYEPDSLTTHHRAISRYLKEQNYGYDIQKDKEFATSRAVLSTRRTQLKAFGKGNKPNQAEPISANEEEKLWQKEQLGCKSPRALQNTM